jgi:hypothetical protein
MYDKRFFALAALPLAVALMFATPGLAHHGFGRYAMDKVADWSRTFKKLELVNPHSYFHFETVDADGKVLEMRCEMRAATGLRRAGWDLDQFTPGKNVEVHGHPHRDDPQSCYLERVTVSGGRAMARDELFSSAAPVDTSNRPLRLASGEPNISGDWATEQGVLTIPPSGGNGAVVPRSLREDYAAGRITLEQIRARTPAPPPPTYTEAGQAAATAYRRTSVEDNPRLSCKPTSIVFDWTWHWPVNRITQTTADGKKVIDIDYGEYGFSRRIHLDLDAHPADLQPSSAGHSIGRWEGDTLVVDTVGFAPGWLVPPTRSSDQLHIVERFTLDPTAFALKRDWTVEDPVYLATPYIGTDTVFLSETPFEKLRCEELAFEFTNR